LRAVVVACAGLFVLSAGSGCAVMNGSPIPTKTAPSNYRNWKAEFATLPEATLADDVVQIKNVRNCLWVTDEDFILRHYDRTFRLSDVRSVDFFVVPFTGAEILAHTMLSFGLADGTYLAISVEVRLEEGTQYDPLLGAMRQFELTYVVADERDVVLLRTAHRKVDVYCYRSTASPAQAQAMLKDMLARVNGLARQPEFYDTITNNCTTNIVDHINRLAAGRAPADVRVMLPGLADQYAYDLGLIDRKLPFAETKRRARINDLADQYLEAPDFSQKIRARMRVPTFSLPPAALSLPSAAASLPPAAASLPPAALASPELSLDLSGMQASPPIAPAP
jgi:hypothetical protein